MARWAKAACGRDQMVLFATTIDDRISSDDPVRLFDEIMDHIDWRSWESQYVLVRGQPPIHPRILASLILYGMTCGIRSSRRLEDACLRRVDFMWLCHDRRVDHSTFCGFRTRFQRELKALYRQVLGVAIRVGMIALNQVALDGTKVRANSSRYATAGSDSLERRLAELTAEIDRQFSAADQADQRGDTLFGKDSTPHRLPAKLSELQQRRACLSKAFAASQRRKAGGCKHTRVPVADPDSSIAPNKDGGYAPNYTPLIAVDTSSGVAVATEVLGDHDECAAAVKAVEAAEENTSRKVRQVVADSAFSSGSNLQALDAMNVEALIPGATRHDPPDNPAHRRRLDLPVSPRQREALPIDSTTKRLARTAFIFDTEADCYWCPMGRKLPFQRKVSKPRRKETVTYRRYRSESCDNCPLAPRCIGTQRRCIDRDRHEPWREQRDERMRSPRGQEAYRRRSPWVEGALGIVKSVMGVTQFSLRGLEKVRTEWLWVITAYNLRKLMAWLTTSATGLAAIASQTS